MKKYCRRLISMVLVLAMVMTTIPSAAAARTKSYISDLKISYDTDGPTAKKALEDQGYTVYEQNLNEEADDAFTKAKVSYIGYKTTKDPKEAITDVAMMSEENGYSFSQYQEMLAAKLSAFDTLVARQMDLIAEFRANYKAGNPWAVQAHRSLNNFREDDSGKLVGDLFLDENLKQEDVFKITTQATQAMTNALNLVLVPAAAEITAENFMTRLSALSASDIVAATSNPNLHVDTMILYEQAVAFKAGYEAAQVHIDEVNLLSEEELEAKSVESEENAKWQMELGQHAKYIGVGEQMKETKVGERSLFDIIMRDQYGAEELNPLTTVLTKGQIAAINFGGFTELMAVTADLTAQEKAEVKALDEETVEVISVYYEVDRAMFSDDVAVTSAALREMNATDDKSALFGTAGSFAMGLGIAAGVSLVATAAMAAFLVKLGPAVNKALLKAGQYSLSMFNPQHIAIAMTRLAPGAAVPVASVGGWIMKATDNPVLYSCLKVANVARVLVIVGIAVAVAMTVLLVIDLYNKYNPEYSKVPKIMLDLYDAEDENVYIRYNVVNGHDGNPGDVNAFSGERWNALYTTKDPAAGKPLEANMVVAFSNTQITEKAYKPIHAFGESTAVNLNKFAFNKDAKTIFLYVSQDIRYEPPKTTASVFMVAMPPIVAALAGILLGATGCFAILKRRRRTATPSAEEGKLD